MKRGARWRPEGVFFTSRRFFCLAKRFAVSVRACVLAFASRRDVFLLCGRGRRRSCGRGRGICGRAGGCRCCLFRRFCRRGCGSSIFCGRTRLRCALAGAVRRVSLLLLFFAWSEGWQLSPFLPWICEKAWESIRRPISLPKAFALPSIVRRTTQEAHAVCDNMPRRMCMCRGEIIRPGASTVATSLTMLLKLRSS